MYNKTLWSELKPGSSSSDDSESGVESFNDYMARVGHLVPNVPRNVLEHWIYRHYTHILNEYIELGIENLRFIQESWESDRIYNDIKSFKGEELGGMGFLVYEIEDEDDAENWLADYMRDQRTLPVPVIVLKNAEIDLLGEPLSLDGRSPTIRLFKGDIPGRENNVKIATRSVGHGNHKITSRMG